MALICSSPLCLVARSGLVDVEADLLAPGLGRDHEFVQRVEDNAELSVVFRLQLGQFLGELCVAVKHLTQLNEGAHDGDVHIDGAFAVQHGREHGDALFGEGHGGVTQPHFIGIGGHKL